MQALQNHKSVTSENFWSDEYHGDKTLLGQEFVDADDSTVIYKIGAVSTKVRFNDFWSNFDDKYLAILATESEITEINADYYPSNLEVCLRVQVGTSPDFAERLMKLSDNQLKVGNLFILKVHDYEDIRADFQQGSVNKIKVRFWMMGFLLLNILLGIIGTFWFLVPSIVKENWDSV